MNENITIELTLQQLNIVLAGIAKLPIEVALEVFNNIQNQAAMQLESKK